MLPTIFKIGPFTLHSYGLMLALAFLSAILLLEARAKRSGLSKDAIMDFGLVVMVASVVGSRAFYVLSHWAEYAPRPLTALAVWEGGLTFYGGVLLAVPAGIIYLKKKGIAFWPLADMAAPAFALGLGIGRLGCFLNGCCFGNPSSLPWAIRFPADTAAGAAFTCALHPTQLYESIFGFIAMALLLWLGKRKYFPGAMFCLFLGMYGVWRFGLDHFRYYEASQLWLLGLANNQWISLGLIVFAIVSSLILWKNNKRQKNK
jgi:phosphatidylglycerol:prolipoprotein diacylglycerol transferase